MAEARQLVLDLQQRPALGRADFIVAPCNETALAWIDRWPDWPQAVLVVHGPAGSGKSHLAQVWRRASGAAELASEDLAAADPSTLLEGQRALLLEDLDRFLAAAGPTEEEQLLHLYNLLREADAQLLVTARLAPARWRCALPDLRSRLLAAHAVALQPPDDRLLEALLVKLFSDRQLRVSQPVVSYILPRVERSFAGLAGLVEAIDLAALSNHREITVPLARRVLDALSRETETESKTEVREE